MADGAASTTEIAPPGPPRVALVAVAGAVVPERIVDALRREVISVFTRSATPRGSDPPPAADVVLAWLPADVRTDNLEALVRWAGSAQLPTGLIGASPGGNRHDLEEALGAGFDDFVIGEVSPRELAARIRALVRRLELSASGAVEGARFGSITLDPSRHQAWIGTHRIELTRTELSIMAALIAARGRAVSRGELLDAVWGDDSFEVGERAVDNVILRLRRKMGDHRAIITVRGVGFRLADL